MANKTASAIIELGNRNETYSFFKAIYEKFSEWFKEDLGDEYDFKLSVDDKTMSIVMERKDGYHKEIVTAKPMGRCLLIETFSPLILFIISDIIEKIPRRVHHRKNVKKTTNENKTLFSI